MNKDFHDQLGEFSGLCTKSLSDDAELCQQVKNELLGHLEDAFEEEQKSVPEQEALQNAMRRFGNPEELSNLLAESNAKRLSLHARIRRAVKWLVLPILIIGILLCIDIRGIMASTAVLRPFVRVWLNQPWRGLEWSVGLKTRKLSEEEQLLFDYYYGNGDRLELLSRLYDMHGDDPMICALFAQEVCLAIHNQLPKAEKLGKMPELLAKGRAIDPTNPLYDYLECFMLMREGSQLSRVGDTPAGTEAVKDRSKMDQAIAVYRQALAKGQVRTYTAELAKRIRGMLTIKEDLLGGLHLLDTDGTRRRMFQPVRQFLPNGVIQYCDFLNQEGDNAKAIELLATWRTLLPQFLCEDGTYVSDISIFSSRLAEDFLKCAKRLDATHEITALKAVADIRREMNKSLRDATVFHRKGGMLSILAGAYSAEGDDIAEWTVERRLEAATFETMFLALACLILVVAIVVFGLHAIVMRLSGRHPFLFILPQSAYINLLLRGILLPALLYLAISHFNAGSGFCGPDFVLHQLYPAIYLCLLWPLFYGVYSRRLLTAWMNSIGAKTHHAFRASRSLNMLCLLAALLLAIGGILRPISYWRQRYYASRETLVIPRDGVEIREKRVIRKWQGRLLEQCKRSASPQNE